VLPESLTFCFDLVPAGTAAGAELVIDRVALRAACVACGTEFAPRDLRSACPSCGQRGLRVTAGRELRLKAIEGE
jgi:hydrogenase nickel incorporation protein HypA/HybF